MGSGWYRRRSIQWLLHEEQICDMRTELDLAKGLLKMEVFSLVLCSSYDDCDAVSLARMAAAQEGQLVVEVGYRAVMEQRHDRGILASVEEGM